MFLEKKIHVYMTELLYTAINRWFKGDTGHLIQDPSAMNVITFPTFLLRSSFQ